MKKTIACALLGLILALGDSVIAAHDPKVPEELRVRDGLPNFVTKLSAGGPVRIAYLGGSITAANGWRPKTSAWFQSQYPDAELIEINAAISGTGSDYGACRIAPDVLALAPDLIFMEHRVNGGGGYEAKSVEGIVRQIWQANPHIDICLVYTISEGMLKSLQAGRQTGFGEVMETMANAYGIPSIDLGVEVAKREKAGDLIFKGNDPVEGKLVFSRDGAHPGDAGHDLYRDVMARSMLSMKSEGVAKAHVLRAPLAAHCWETTALLPITETVLSPGWKAVDTETDPVYRDDVGRTHGMLRGAVKCDRVGETITVAWHGTTIGFSDIPQGSGMEIEVTIDQADPITLKRPQRESVRRYARFVYLPEQSPGDHTAVLRVTKLPDGLSFYAGQVLVIGTVPDHTRHSDITVASYYFGQYHPNDPRNMKTRGKAWSEWELIKAARPRFPGHQQPKVPLWGYEDESNPQVMAKKIDAAADHGIDAFIFDWYYYEDGPFLDRPIDEGFLKARNNHRLKFAFMWANHDWLKNLFPYKKGTPQEVLYPGKVSPAGFERIGDHLIKDYFVHPSYWRIEGKPYFSFYDLTRLLESFGSVAATREGLDRFRAKARSAGLPGLHLNAVAWGQPILPGESVPLDLARLVRDLGFDSVTSYVWVHHASMPQPQTDYNVVRDAYFGYWDRAKAIFDVPYFPNVSMGWDPSPRCDQNDTFDNSGYPFTHMIKDNTPENFETALTRVKNRLMADPVGPRIMNINCWNEWTEGSYLEPDRVHGMKYLEAVKQVFVDGPR